MLKAELMSKLGYDRGTKWSGRVEDKISGVKEFSELVGQSGERIVFQWILEVP